MSVRGGFRIVNSVGRGNSTFFKEKSGNLKNVGL